MKLVPAALEQHVNGVDRQRALVIGISTGLLAFWSAYRVFWSLYLSLTYDFLFGSLIFQVVLWGVIGVAAGLTSAAFVGRYLSTSAANTPHEHR
ncbi:hypothetical protein EV589_5409 [Mycobacterium sp. BK558]|nr:hypothetical protein EV589_5409 [Mycobacterium sp. BK558]